MPNRILREGILESELVCSLPWAAEVLYRRLISVVDDYGRFPATPKLIRAKCYPLQIDKVSDSDIGKWLTQVVEAALVRVYPAQDGKRYLQVEKFGQQVRSRSKYPPPPDVCDQLLADAKQPIANAHLDVDVDVDVDEEEQQGASPDGAALIESPPAQRLKPDPIPYQAIADAYNRELTRLPKVQTITPKRRTLMRTAWQADPRFRSIGFWADYFAACEADPFRNGTGPYANGHANWRPTLDYLLRADVVVGLVERVATPGGVP